MHKKIEKIKNFRLYLLSQIEDLGSLALNEVPAGQNNNIIWNLGHLISAQQTMCYVRSGQPITVKEDFLKAYQTGTQPEFFIDDQDVMHIKQMLIKSIDQLQKDYDKNIFGNYTPSAKIPEIYGFEVNNIEDALEYLLYHEGYHTAHILALAAATSSEIE